MPRSSIASAAVGDTLHWLNAIFSSLWPHATTAIKSTIENDVLPKLRKLVPSLTGKLRFIKFSLGKSFPSFGPISVHKLSDSANKVRLEIELALNYDGSDLDILLDSGIGPTVGIKKIKVEDAKICVVLTPLLNVIPIIGSVQIYFCKLPKIQWEFEGIAAVPGLEEAIVSEGLERLLLKELVLPNKRNFF